MFEVLSVMILTAVFTTGFWFELSVNIGGGVGNSESNDESDDESDDVVNPE